MNFVFLGNVQLGEHESESKLVCYYCYYVTVQVTKQVLPSAIVFVTTT